MATIWTEVIISTPDQFWSELEETLSVPAKATLEQMDLALKTFIYCCARFYHQFLRSDQGLDRAVQLLLHAAFFESHSDRMVNLLVDLVESRQSQDPVDSVTKLHVLLHTLLVYGHRRPHVFKLLRLSRKSNTMTKAHPFVDLLIAVLHRTEEEAQATGEDGSVEGMIGLEATELLYEILRVKRLSKEELPLFTEAFITHLFDIVEQTRDEDERYNYAMIRLIIALNEQFMVVGLEGQQNGVKKQAHTSHATNLVLQILKTKLGESKTFGENLIFILNRLNSSSEEASPEDLCVSLLILKLLYMLFSTASTSEYFYTNDLRVLVDVFIRELLDLPEESEGLRHTYLRVLHPLMTNTQLRMYPYKREAVRATLLCLLSDDHIRTVSPTTRRLVERNLKADWCRALDPPPPTQSEVQAEAELAKEMSTVALKGPAASLKLEESRQSNGSTLSVHAVADAELPADGGSKPKRGLSMSSHSSSNSKSKGHHHHEHRVGHAHENSHDHVHGRNHTTVVMPQHRHRTNSHGSHTSPAETPTEPTPAPRHHRPAPSPPRRRTNSSGLTASTIHEHDESALHNDGSHGEHAVTDASLHALAEGGSRPKRGNSMHSTSGYSSDQSKGSKGHRHHHEHRVGHSHEHGSEHVHGRNHATVVMPKFRRRTSSHSSQSSQPSPGLSANEPAPAPRHHRPAPLPPKKRTSSNSFATSPIHEHDEHTHLDSHTLEEYAVADAESVTSLEGGSRPQRTHTASSFSSDHSSRKGHHHHEHRVGHSHEHGHEHVHGRNHTTVVMPQHRHRTNSHSSHGSQPSPSIIVDEPVPVPRHRPAPLPPRKHNGSHHSHPPTPHRQMSSGESHHPSTAHEYASKPHAYRRTASYGQQSNGSSGQADHDSAPELATGSVDSPVIPKRVPPPRPPKGRSTQSLPTTPPGTPPEGVQAEFPDTFPEITHSHPLVRKFRRAPPPAPARKRGTTLHSEMSHAEQ